MNGEEKNKLYDTFIGHIQKLHNLSHDDKSTNEIDDITLLWSLLKQDVKDIINGNEYVPKNEEINVNLKYNILREYWAIIKTPSFLEKIYQLQQIDDDDDDEGAKFKNEYVKIYETFLAFKQDSIESIQLSISEPESPYSFLQFLTINNVQKDLIESEPLIKIIPLILYNLYLECAMYQYTNILEYVKLTRNALYELGTRKYTSNDEFKSNIMNWLIYKQKIKAQLHNDDKTYKFSINVDEIQKQEYLQFSALYDADELTKIKLLTKQRHELVRSKESSQNINRQTFNNQIDEVFKNDKLYLSINLQNSATVEYIIMQAMYTYDQIIATMCEERMIHLHYLRRQNITNLDNIHKHIITFRQYIAHPFTFQYKITDYRQCHNLMSEKTMKIIFEKMIKLALITDYCNSNELTNMQTTKKNTVPITTPIPNVTETNDVYRRELMMRILNDINKSFKEMTTFKLETNNSADEIKHLLKQLYTLFKDSPYDNLLLKTNIKTTYANIDKQSLMHDMQTAFDNIVEKYEKIDLKKNDYCYEKYKNMLDDINNHVYMFDYAKTCLSEYMTGTNNVVTLIANVIKSIEQCATNIIQIKQLTDKDELLDWKSSYVNSNLDEITNNGKFDYDIGKEMEEGNIILLTTYNLKFMAACDLFTQNKNKFTYKFEKLSDELNKYHQNMKDIHVKMLDFMKLLESDLFAKITELMTLQYEGAAVEKTIETAKINLSLFNNHISIIDKKIFNKNNEIKKLSQINEFLIAGPKGPNKSFNATQQNKYELNNANINKAKAEIAELNNVKEKTNKHITSETTILENNNDIYSIKTNEINTLLNQIKCITSLLYDVKLQANIACYSDFDKQIIDCINAYDEAKKQYVDDYLLNPAHTFSFVTLQSKISAQFGKMQKIIALFHHIKNRDPIVHELNMYENNIKKQMLELNDLSYQINVMYRHADKIIHSEYGINPISTSIEMAYGELFKEDVDENNMNTFIAEYDENLYKSKHQTVFNHMLYRHSKKTNDLISTYQIVEMLNYNPVFALSEKLYAHLVALGEIRELPSIDTIIEMLKFENYMEFSKENTYIISSINIENECYMKTHNSHMNKSLSKLSILKFPLSIYEMLTENIKNKHMTPNKIDDAKFFINAYDANNKIKLNIEMILQMLNEIDISKFIRNYYKIIRNQYIRVYPDTSNFSTKKIPFDDLHFYNMSMSAKYDNVDELYPVSYFTLGNVISSPDREIINFGNNINSAMVRILEMTNSL